MATPTASRPVVPPLWAAAAIGHFPAQALAAVCPHLRGTAYAVVEQGADSCRAGCLALSPSARRLGAAPGTPVFLLKRRLGAALTTLSRDGVAEAAVRTRLRDACVDHTPEFRLGHGRVRLEVFLDLTGTPAARRWGHAGVGAALRVTLSRRTGLEEVSVGVSRSRLVAQVLARQGGDDGVAVCPPGAELQHLAGLDAGHLPGVAGACRERARRFGIEGVDQLLRCDRATLVRHFGRQAGEGLYGLVRGVAVQPAAETRGEVTAETVLDHDLNDDRLLGQVVRLTVDKACHALRQAGRVAGGLRLRLTYTDHRRVQKTVCLGPATDAFVTLEAAAQRLFAQVHVRRAAIKSVAVAATRVGQATGQADLFEGAAGRRQRQLGTALTDIRRRLGFEAVVTAGVVELAGGRAQGARPRRRPSQPRR